MSRLDFNAPYGIVYDMPGVRYQQHGRYYRGNGSPVDEAQEREEAPDQAGAPVVKKDGWTVDDLRRPENKALKAQLDVYGEAWTTAAAAREFLSKGRE